MAERLPRMITESLSDRPEVLVVIPARGGSKGIPRKNLRMLAGKPLISYGIRTALQSQFQPDVYVSSDDDEILSVAAKCGARAIKRDASIAVDATTLDPVVHDACIRIEASAGKRYDLVVTLQPTSPLLKTESLDAALQKLLDNPGTDTVISAMSDAHLSWGLSDGKFVPNYAARVNRQSLPPVFRETGGFLITRRHCVTETGRIGTNVDLVLLSGGEQIDIDSHDDWSLCEFHLRRKRIVFVVTGNSTVGLGHVYNTLAVANDILDHHIEFLVDRDSQMAHDAIATRNYPVRMQEAADIVDDVLAMGADLVVNDRLDTSAAYVSCLKAHGLGVVNFEDLGPGAALADLVVNAIYPEKQALPRHYFGPRYFVLRDEFILAGAVEVKREVSRVLLTFGGVDPNNLTRKVLSAIHAYCHERGIQITVATGFGYADFASIDGFDGVTVVRNASNISEHMSNAGVVFTSAGRTVYEVAALGVPAIVLAQNARELTHFFASAEYGFEALGLGTEVSATVLLERFVRVVESFDIRASMSRKMGSADLSGGRRRVNSLIRELLELDTGSDP